MVSGVQESPRAVDISALEASDTHSVCLLVPKAGTMSIPTSFNLPFRVLEETAQVTAASDPGLDLTQYLLISAAMVVGIGALGWFFQKTIAGSVLSRAEKRSLRIVDVLPMGGKRKLAVVKIYDRTFVVGLGDKELSLITELDGEIPERSELAPKGSKAKAAGIARAFEAIRSRVGEGIPKPQPKTRPTPQKQSLAATLNRVARQVAASKPSVTGKTDSSAGLGDGRGLLG